VLAESFERIHRSNLVGMGILPLQFLPGESAESLGLTGTEAVTVTGLAPLDSGEVPDTAQVTADERTFAMRIRLDTSRDVDYYRHGGITKYVMRKLLGAS
jgi:aconitate hydratase